MTVTDERELEIRPVEPGELDVLQQIRVLAFAPVFRSFRDSLGAEIADVALASAEAEQAQELEKLCDPATRQDVFVAVVHGTILGFVSLSLDHEKAIGEIGLNAVHPDHAGRGIGTALYRFALERMTEAGMRVAAVGTGGDPAHAAARRAYQKAGFGPSIPGLYMYRSL